jgi:stearoyl-CoA desaturase (delta-9 desaturase)
LKLKIGNREINWPNALYLVLTPFAAVIGMIWWIKSGSFNWNTVILACLLYLFCQISITAGYHRLFSHRSYNAVWPVRLFFLIFGAAAFEGSAMHWSLDHRNHHNYVDQNERDPYSINKGFFWAHMGWLLFKQNDQVYSEENTKSGDLYSDKLVVWQLHNWVWVGVVVTFVVPTIIGLAWGDALGAMVVAGLVRSVLNHHATFLINSLSHCVGKQTYSDKHTARDNLFTAFLTCGEGYHNYHHEFPSDYRNGVRAWDWDPTKWVIKGLSLVKMTTDLKTIHEEIILRKRTHMREKRLHKKLAGSSFKFFGSTQAQILESLKMKYEKSYQQLAELRMKLQTLSTKYQNKKQAQENKSFVKLELDVLKEQVAQAKYDFQKSVKDWNIMRKRILAYAKS